MEKGDSDPYALTFEGFAPTPEALAELREYVALRKAATHYFSEHPVLRELLSWIRTYLPDSQSGFV